MRARETEKKRSTRLRVHPVFPEEHYKGGMYIHSESRVLHEVRPRVLLRVAGFLLVLVAGCCWCWRCCG